MKIEYEDIICKERRGLAENAAMVGHEAGIDVDSFRSVMNVVYEGCSKEEEEEVLRRLKLLYQQSHPEERCSPLFSTVVKQAITLDEVHRFLGAIKVFFKRGFQPHLLTKETVELELGLVLGVLSMDIDSMLEKIDGELTLEMQDDDESKDDDIYRCEYIVFDCGRNSIGCMRKTNN